jgi:hypothetical protein
MQARLCLSADVALLLALLLGLLGGVMAEPGATWTIVAVVSGVAGAAVVGCAETRATLFAAGLLAGIAGSGAAVALEALRSALDARELFWLGASSLTGGVLAGLVRCGGPLPRSRESALVMLADQVAPAARALQKPSEEALREVVDHRIDRALVKDALARCEIALCDLDRVRDAFHRGLLNLHTQGQRAGKSAEP